MSDIVSVEKRSQMMSGIRAKNTKPELLIRKELHRLGFRYSLHRKDLKGKPDLVFPKYKAVIFIHGCFWHRHDCLLFKWPSSQQEFWKIKLDRNFITDEKNIKELRKNDWRVGVVWECSIRGKNRQPLSDVIMKCKTWLKSTERFLEIKSHQ